MDYPRNEYHPLVINSLDIHDKLDDLEDGFVNSDEEFKNLIGVSIKDILIALFRGSLIDVSPLIIFGVSMIGESPKNEFYYTANDEGFQLTLGKHFSENDILAGFTFTSSYSFTDDGLNETNIYEIVDNIVDNFVQIAAYDR